MKALKLIGVAIVIILIVIQFFPAKKNLGENGTANDLIVMYNAPADVSQLLKSACYDCHSNHTEYPWYNSVQPVGWFLANDIKEGKEHLNMDDFGSYSTGRQQGELEGMIEHIEENEMPLPAYRLMHRDARLSDEQKQTLTSWLGKTAELIK